MSSFRKLVKVGEGRIFININLILKFYKFLEFIKKKSPVWKVKNDNSMFLNRTYIEFKNPIYVPWAGIFRMGYL